MRGLLLDEVYRDYRIAITLANECVARITHVRGHVVPLSVRTPLDQGHEACLKRAREQIDRYIAFLDGRET